MYPRYSCTVPCIQKATEQVYLVGLDDALSMLKDKTLILSPSPSLFKLSISSTLLELEYIADDGYNPS
eukprot:snap_masked-scaffold_62-processed-gene-0.44-mRNA-1 protein AED:1.00 eAED:1.00 QI:0/0/0/0/1/1/2/0/67